MDLRSVNLSLNEYQALVKKAVRGAGLSWGVASETARALRLAWQVDWNATADLLEILRQHEQQGPAWGAPLELDGTWSAGEGALSPLMVGLCLCDQRDALRGRDQVVERLAQPNLLVPFLLLAAQNTGLGFEVHLDGRVWQVDAGGVQGARAGDQAATAQIIGRAGRAYGQALHPRVDLDPAELQGLNAFADRTYAPATEASRLAGAGAGLSDND